MQYQVFRKSDNVVIAWIDTNSPDIIVHTDYGVKFGGDLKVEQKEEQV